MFCRGFSELKVDFMVLLNTCIYYFYNIHPEVRDFDHCSIIMHANIAKHRVGFSTTQQIFILSVNSLIGKKAYSTALNLHFYIREGLNSVLARHRELLSCIFITFQPTLICHFYFVLATLIIKHNVQHYLFCSTTKLKNLSKNNH